MCSKSPSASPEGAQHLRIELTVRAFAHGEDRVVMRQRHLVWAPGTERIVDVADRDDSGRQRDVVAGKPVRVTGAIETFVVMADDVHRCAEVRLCEIVALGDHPERFEADDRVRFHHAALVWVELAGLQ